MKKTTGSNGGFFGIKTLASSALYSMQTYTNKLAPKNNKVNRLTTPGNKPIDKCDNKPVNRQVTFPPQNTDSPLNSNSSSNNAVIKPYPGNARSDAPGVYAVLGGQGVVPGSPAPSTTLGRPEVYTPGDNIDNNSPSYPYKEYEAKPANTPLVEHNCRYQVMAVGECENCGTVVGKIIYCGQEWCPTCGKQWSSAHKRRFSRYLYRAKQIKKMGYLVIQPNDAHRHDAAFYTKDGLRGTTTKIVGVLAGKRAGRYGRKDPWFDNGIGRWHWFGDKIPGKYNPHYNTLLDFDTFSKERRQEYQSEVDAYQKQLEGQLASCTKEKQKKYFRKLLKGIELYNSGESGFLPAPVIDHLKAELKTALGLPDLVGPSGRPVPQLIVEYRFKATIPHMVHAVKYVTRATFLDKEWDPWLADELEGFRNCRWWGKWHTAEEMKDNPSLSVWPSDAKDPYYANTAVMETGRCHKCNGQLIWRDKLEPSCYLNHWILKDKAREIGAGYYELDLLPGDPVTVSSFGVSIKRQQELSGERQVINVTMAMLKRRGDYLTERHRVGQSIESARVIYNRRSVYDSYWDDPNSEGFIDPSDKGARLYAK